MYAVNIALIPDDPLMTECIRLNSALGSERRITLSPKSSLPHVTLLMGCLDENRLDEVASSLSIVASGTDPICMQISGPVEYRSPRGDAILHLGVADSAPLETLRASVTRAVAPSLSFDPDVQMLYDHSGADPMTLSWISGFGGVVRGESAYHPHITLGFGELLPGPYPTEGRFSTLVICHVGEYCTCGKVLASFPLARER